MSEFYQQTFVLELLLSLLPQNINKSAYTTFVRPFLEYSSSVWNPHTKIIIDQ